jgi:flagellar hook-associated protein 3 FlgL
MRISTSMIYSQGVSTINRKTAEMLHIQQQVSSGKRMLTPSDDPIASSRALEITQSKQITIQYDTNLGNATEALKLEETQLQSAGDIISRVRELAVNGGNGSLTSDDRRSLTHELRARFDELLGVANAADGLGLFMFSGYMGSTKPFGGSVDGLNQAVANDINYAGDDGQRRMQVSTSRQLEVSDSGIDVFVRIPQGNGYFSTDFNNANTGTGVIDGGSIINPTTWNNLTNQNYQVKFWVDSSNPITPKTYYDIIDTTNDVSMITGATPQSPPAAYPGGLREYKSGQAITLSTQTGDTNTFDLGGQVMITGDPGDGDSFSLAPSASQSVFKTIASLIGALETAQTGTPAGSAALSNRIGFALTNLDRAVDKILEVRASVGSRMSEAESLQNTAQDLVLQYKESLSNLEDLDYAQTITDLTRKQTDLEAAQKSFVAISKLALFNYL